MSNESAAEEVGEVYHVVCHDCEYKQIWSMERAARGTTTTHSAEYGHDVEWANIGQKVATDGGQSVGGSNDV